MYSPLLKFFNNLNKESDFDKDLDTILMKALILRFSKGPEKNSISLHRISDHIPTAKKLFDDTEGCRSPIKSINKVTDLDTQLSNGINWFQSRGSRGEYLQAAYSYLGTVSKTYVECERYLSTTPYVDNKNQSDDMLVMLMLIY